MKCLCCSKKPAILNCKQCSHVYCTNCIQLETHKCSSLEKYILAERKKLKESLPVIKASKVIPF